MIAQELEVSLHMAFVEARQARHEFITVEHLLLALLDNPSGAEVLRACACDIEDLRKSLCDFVSDNTPALPQSSEADTQPTLGFQRVIQRAIMHVQATHNDGTRTVSGADVLMAIFGEKDSHAVYYLHRQGVTRADVVNFISHGLIGGGPDAQRQPGDAAQGTHGREASSAALEELVVQARDGRISPLIGRAIMEARRARHESVTVEHLLLGLLEDVAAAQVLRAWACDIEGLRERLVSFLSRSMPVLARNSGTGTRPAASFVRTIRRASQAAIVRDMTPVQSAPGGKERVTGADVLAAIFEQEGSHALGCLRACTPNLNLWPEGRSLDRLPEGAMRAGKENFPGNSRADDADAAGGPS